MAQATIATLAALLGLSEEALTQAISAAQGAATEVVLCGQALFTKDGICSAPATTEEGTCAKHTAAKKAAHAASVVAQAQRASQRETFRAEREKVARAEVAAAGEYVMLTKYDGTVAGRSRRDLWALGVRGISKSTPVAEAIALAEQAGLKVRTVAALQVTRAN